MRPERSTTATKQIKIKCRSITQSAGVGYKPYIDQVSGLALHDCHRSGRLDAVLIFLSLSTACELCDDQNCRLDPEISDPWKRTRVQVAISQSRDIILHRIWDNPTEIVTELLGDVLPICPLELFRPFLLTQLSVSPQARSAAILRRPSLQAKIASPKVLPSPDADLWYAHQQRRSPKNSTQER